MSKKDDPRYVTQAQCAKQVKEVTRELETVKIALIGEDMRGGLVKDVQYIKTMVDKETMSWQAKATIIGSLCLSIASIIVAVIQSLPRF